MSRKKSRQKGVRNTIARNIIEFVQSIFPYPTNAKNVAIHVRCKISTASRTLNRLANQRNRGIKKYYVRGFYIADIIKDNLANLEIPEIQVHNLKLQFTPIQTKNTVTPRSLNSKKTRQENEKYFWFYNDYSYKVSIQINPTGTFTAHLGSSKKPLSQIGVRDFIIWLKGLFAAKKIDTDIYDCKPVLFELNHDYRLVEICPKSITLKDIQNQAFLRIYRKYWNLTRLEVRTNYAGDKEIYQLYKEFVKPSINDVPPDDFMDVV